MNSAGSEAILVLGMHRSGTSAVAGVLSLLGATTPATMLPAAVDNPSGFWEATSLLGVNDWILNENGAVWYDCLEFDANALDARTRAIALTMVMLCMRAEFGAAPLKLVKDPRLCLLLDLWLPALSAIGTSPAVVLVLRSPDEVAQSLEAREHIPRGISDALWLRYMLDAEYATRSCRRHVMAYEDLVHDWRRVLTWTGQRMAITWPVGLNEAAPRLDRFLSVGLRHFYSGPWRTPPAATPLTNWLDEAYAALQGLAQDGTDQLQLDRLDVVRTAFQTWCRSQGRAWTDALLHGHAIRETRRFNVPLDWYRIASGIPNAITLPAG
jgi:hypothetical protein